MILIQYLLPFLLLITTSLHADYYLKESKRTPSAIDNMPKNSVRDMRTIPQDPSYYTPQIKAFVTSEQKRLDRAFNRKYFKPWYLKRLDVPKEDLGWEVRFVTKKPIYRSNGRVIPRSVYNRWIKNANMKALNTKRYKAITIRRTDVKALPTTNTFYRNPQKIGEGFPFDYNQNSAYHINLPLFVSHYSLDKRWAFVQGAYTFGWVQVRDIALVNTKFIKKFQNHNYAMTIKDNLRLYDRNSKAVSIVKLGALFPIQKHRYLVARRGSAGYAKAEPVVLKQSGLLAKKPLAFTPQNVAAIAKEFYNEPYGWGGRNECRDCSATTRDFLGPFGIFLRRNSSKQAKDGKSIHIKGLPAAVKKRTIINKAKPFRSLLHVPGHVVLYLGAYKGEPVIMHTYWGIRKKDGSKLVTGRTIITSTEPGKERKDIKESSKLIHTLQRIVNFD
jgi:cell wall-associated NlpC family hydrolase